MELLDFQEPMVDGADTADIVDMADIMVDTVDTLEERGLPMLNLRPKLNPRDLGMLRLYLRLTLMLNMDTMDIPPPIDTMVDIIPVLTDMDTTDTDILERDLPNLNLNTMILANTTIHAIVDSSDTTIIEMFEKYLI